MTATRNVFDEMRQALIRHFEQRSDLLFCFWLAYYAGSEHEGTRRPAYALNSEQAAALLGDLDPEQLEELIYRFPILFGWEESPVIEPRYDQPVGTLGARTVYDPYQQVTVYRCSDGRLRLLSGDLDRLVAAGFPEAPAEVAAVLWHRIAPVERSPEPEED